jgi:hypothetical protein
MTAYSDRLWGEVQAWETQGTWWTNENLRMCARSLYIRILENILFVS